MKKVVVQWTAVEKLETPNLNCIKKGIFFNYSNSVLYSDTIFNIYIFAISVVVSIFCNGGH